MTLPKLKIEGLWLGAPYVELDGDSFIQSSSGYLTTIKYSGKGWVSGHAHSFTATVGSPSVPKLHSIEGVWTGESKYAKGSSGGNEGKLFLNAGGERTPIVVKPVEEQNEFESRKAWKKVADGIKKGERASDRTVRLLY